MDGPDTGMAVANSRQTRLAIWLEDSVYRLLRQQSIRWHLLLGAGEFVLFAVSLYLATCLRYVADPAQMHEYMHHLVERSAVFAAVMMFGMAALGLYQPQMRETRFGILARQAVAFAVSGFALVVLYYVLPQAYVGRGILVIAMLLSLLFVSLYRAAFQHMVNTEVLKRRIIVLGAGRRAVEIHDRLRRRADRRGFHVVGFIPRPGEPVCLPPDRLLDPSQSLWEWIKQSQADEIVVGVDERRGGLPMQELLECRQYGVAVTDLTTFFERESGRVQLSIIDPSWLVFSGGFNATPLRRLSKRCFDLGVSGLVLLLAWPAMLLVALAIRIESGAGQPILYRQERVGMRGRTFRLIKFRSMRTDAEMDGVARWAKKDDDRVTRVGRITRKLRLDELPQLWNVFKGDMSFIGPRPERPQFVSDLAGKIRFYELRHCLKPGLSGWAQLRYPYGASEQDAVEKLKYDLFYVKNHNLLFDLLILIQTVEVVLFGRGAR